MPGISDSDRKGGDLWDGRRPDRGCRVGGKARHDQGKTRFYLSSEDERPDRGVLAGATQGEQKIIEQTAGEVGLAFQIQDDILDVTSTMEVLGKPIGSDEKNHKITYVTYEGIEKAKADVASLSEQAIARMDSLVVKNEYLTELLRYLILREK